MKRAVWATLISLGLLVSSLSFAWTMIPRSTADVLLLLNNVSAGLTAKSIQTEIGKVHYLEGGQGETIVLLHGIYSRKEHWVELVRYLESDYHIIAIDMPGFGDNDILADDQYSLQNQTANLATVMDALNIKTAHFSVNSMGAQIAAMLAKKRPELVLSLAFIGSPLGVPTPIKSDMDLALEQGQIPLLVKTEADFYARNDWLFPKTPSVPSPIIKSWLYKEVSTAAANERIWYSVHNFSGVPTLLELAPELPMEALTIWCDEDRIFHSSGAQRLDAALPSSRAITLAGCGHVPMLDKPEEVSEIYKKFLMDASREERPQRESTAMLH